MILTYSKQSTMASESLLDDWIWISASLLEQLSILVFSYDMHLSNIFVSSIIINTGIMENLFV